MSALADTTNTTIKEDNKKTVVVKSPEKAGDVVDAKEDATPVDKADATPVEKKVDDVKPTSDVVPHLTSEQCEGAEESTGEETPMEEETAEKTDPEEITKSLNEQLKTGRRFMETNSFNEAAECFSAAASFAAVSYGEGHEATFEANFLYGKALLELAKVEDGVLTNALTDIPKATSGDEEVQDDIVGNPDNVPQEERAEIKQKVEEALGIVSEEAAPIENIVGEQQMDAEKAAPEAEEAKEQNTEGEAASEETEDVEMVPVEEKAADEQEADAEGSEGEDEDEPMKLSWELLETSRCICERKLKALEADENVDAKAVKTWKLNHADVLTSLGEHGVADSKHEQAQKDLAEALAIQTIHLSPTSRVLANTTHLLAKAFSADALFEKAATHFSDSKNVLIAKSEELKKQLETASDDAKNDIESEIKELDEIIPELDAFVVDARASAEQTEKIKAAALKELEGVAAAFAKIEGKEATDISSMVRRPTKRPASEEPKEEVKKRKSEDGAGTVPDEKAAETTTEESETAPAPVSQE